MDQHAVNGHINTGFKLNDLQENGQESKQEVHFFYLCLAFKVMDKCLMLLSTIQIYFGYIVVVSFIGGGNRSSCRKSLTNSITSVVSSTPRLSGIRTHNVSGDRH